MGVAVGGGVLAGVDVGPLVGEDGGGGGGALPSPFHTAGPGTL